MKTYINGLLEDNHRYALLVTGGIAPSVALLQQFIVAYPQVPVYCADGGADYCKEANVVPKNIIGDMDSISKETRQWLQEKNVEEYIYPVEKDYSDTALAVEALFHDGYEELLILGALGGRMDHELANMMELVRSGREGKSIVFWDDGNALRYVGKGIHQLKRCDGYVGIIPFSDQGMQLSIEGLYYRLEETRIPFGESRMISNEFRDHDLAQIDIKEGDGVLVVSHDRREKRQ